MGEHAAHLRTIETRGQFIEAAPAALRVERAQFVQLVESESHHVGEGGLVNLAHQILKIDPPAVFGAGIEIGDFDQVAVVSAQSDDIVFVAGLRECGEMRALVPALDRNPPAIGAGHDNQSTGAGQLRVKHTTPKQSLEAEKHGADKLQQRCLAGLVGAVEHLHARAEIGHRHIPQRSESFDLNPFDEHAILSLLAQAIPAASGRFDQFQCQPAGLTGHVGGHGQPGKTLGSRRLIFNAHDDVGQSRRK